jgi:hypothetical protein
MKFIFVCPIHQKVFESDAFNLTENKGVKVDAEGRKYLDAKVNLSGPCPYCGERHSFAARELACPFNRYKEGV